MNAPHVIRLELLRSGPRHNHLLSPLTPYIAVCNGQACDFRVPFEHAELTGLTAAAFGSSDPACRERSRGTLERHIVDLFRGMYPLTAALGDGCTEVELRLVVSADELAAIPFELAFPATPMGHAVTQRCVRLVRQIGGALPDGRPWPLVPRVVVAIGPGISDGLAEAHVSALARAIEPWLQTQSRSELEEYLQIVRFRTLDELARPLSRRARRAASRRSLGLDSGTHLHILAHGVPRTGGTYGLDLEPVAATPKELAAVVGSITPLPAMVSLMTCWSGARGNVAIPGGSMGQALHEAGVKLVLASQAPLSYSGSVRFALAFFEYVLRHGSSPADALMEARRRLSQHQSTQLDWAAIVAYGAYDSRDARGARRTRVGMLRKQLNALLARLDPDSVARATGELLLGLPEGETLADRTVAIQQAASGDPDLETDTDRFIESVWARAADAVLRPIGDVEDEARGEGARSELERRLQAIGDWAWRAPAREPLTATSAVRLRGWAAGECFRRAAEACDRAFWRHGFGPRTMILLGRAAIDLALASRAEREHLSMLRAVFERIRSLDRERSASDEERPAGVPRTEADRRRTAARVEWELSVAEWWTAPDPASREQVDLDFEALVALGPPDFFLHSVRRQVERLQGALAAGVGEPPKEAAGVVKAWLARCEARQIPRKMPPVLTD